MPFRNSQFDMLQRDLNLVQFWTALGMLNTKPASSRPEPEAFHLFEAGSGARVAVRIWLPLPESADRLRDHTAP